MRTNVLWLLVAVFLLCGCGRNVGFVLKPVKLDEALTETVLKSDPGWFVTDKILLLDVDGLLFNKRKGGLLSGGPNPVSLMVEKLDKAEADPHVKAVVIRINSPGGSVTASDIIYERIQRFRSKRKVPVIAIIEDVGASGGYYIACASDTIVAHPTSVTGSIGTIVQTISLAGTLKMLHIEAKAVVSGPRKDMVSPFKPLDPDDLAILQGMVDEFYERFLRVVDEARTQLDADQVKALADGRVFTGGQAKANGLVDELGRVWDAVELAKRKSKATRVKVVMYHRQMGYRANVYSAAQNPPANQQFNLVNISANDLLAAGTPQFLWLWTGHTHR